MILEEKDLPDWKEFYLSAIKAGATAQYACGVADKFIEDRNDRLVTRIPVFIKLGQKQVEPGEMVDIPGKSLFGRVS